MSVNTNGNLQFRWMQRDAEMRVDGGESRTIVGYAAVFNSETQIYSDTTEVIRPEAFNATDMNAVVCLFNHDYNQMLASATGGSLRLSVDARGLRFEADVAATVAGDQVLELVRRGDLHGCSFSFWTRSDKWTAREDGTYLRELLDIAKIDDVGPVVRPAYDETSVSLRSYYEAQKQPKVDPAIKPQARLNNDWRDLIAAWRK